MSTMNHSLDGLRIAVAMPIFNESDGIVETLTSIAEAFRHSGATVTMCIQNDVSTDNTLQVISELATTLQLKITVETNQQNSGHGPTAIVAGSDIAIGIRSNRVDPWFRKFLTYLLRNFLRARYVGRFPDPNSPIRAYSASVLTSMLNELPSEPLIPNIYLSILAVRKKLDVSYLHVSHRERRGGQSTGTMWQSTSQWKRISRLLKFCRKSFRQLLSF
jgi:glycosyltransferase involved in cell wall biosynthesis